MPSLAVGIDAGGTSLRIRAADLEGQVLVDQQGQASADLGPESLDSLLSSLNNQLANVGAVCAGIAGITRAGLRERWHEHLSRVFPNAVLELTPDYTIAFRGAIVEFGILVIAGTGSVVYGERQELQCRVGGRGWEWGDWGSGAWITAEILRLTLNALDGLDERSEFVEAVLAQCGSEDPIALCDWARRMSQTDGRGFLIPLAARRAHLGDRRVLTLFEAGADWLSRQVKSAAIRLAFDRAEQFPIATAGGLWQCGDCIVEPFAERIKDLYPAASIVSPGASAIDGATRQAMVLLEQKIG